VFFDPCIEEICIETTLHSYTYNNIQLFTHIYTQSHTLIIYVKNEVHVTRELIEEYTY
jgi:hypothetical protein